MRDKLSRCMPGAGIEPAHLSVGDFKSDIGGSQEGITPVARPGASATMHGHARESARTVTSAATSDAKHRRAQQAARRAAIARDVEHGAMTQAEVARAYGITRARVGQIVKRVREDERKARCARGEHGRPLYSSYMVQRPDGTTVQVPHATCADCGAEVEP